MQINEILQTHKLHTTVSDSPHELSASVDYVKHHIGFTARYNGGYWLSKIKKSGMTCYQIRALVDKAMSLDKKYSRGGFLTNSLK